MRSRDEDSVAASEGKHSNEVAGRDIKENYRLVGTGVSERGDVQRLKQSTKHD